MERPTATHWAVATSALAVTVPVRTSLLSGLYFVCIADISVSGSWREIIVIVDVVDEVLPKELLTYTVTVTAIVGITFPLPAVDLEAGKVNTPGLELDMT